MPLHYYVALSDPVDGREEEYNDWYQNRHIPDILDVPGFVSARRFGAVDAGDGAPQRRRHMVIYEIEADDPATVLAALRARRGTDRLIMSEAFDAKSLFAQVYAPIGEAIFPSERNG